MGCTCAGNVQAQTGRRQAASALAPLYLSALLPGEMEGKEGSGRAMGSTPRLAVSSGSLLSLASGWLFAGLLCWGPYGGGCRAAANWQLAVCSIGGAPVLPFCHCWQWAAAAAAGASSPGRSQPKPGCTHLGDGAEPVRANPLCWAWFANGCGIVSKWCIVRQNDLLLRAVP